MHKSLLDYLWVLVLAMGGGYLLPGIGTVVGEYMQWYLMGILFVSGLKIKSRDIVKLRHRLGMISKLVGIRVLVLPVLVWVFSGLFVPEYQLAFMLLILTPVGMASSLFTTLLGGNGSLTLSLTVITALFTPFLLPFFVKVFFGELVDIGTVDLMKNLFQVLVVPVVAAEVCQLFFPRLVKKTSGLIQPASYLFLFLVLYGTFAVHRETLLSLSGVQFVESFVWSCLLLLSLALVGWFISLKYRIKDRIAVVMSFMLMNYALAIYLGNTFFPDQILVVIVTVLVSIPWNLSIVVFDGFLARRRF